MIRGKREGIGVAVMIGLIAFAMSRAMAAEDPTAGEPFAVDATALVPLEDESALSIVGIRGRILISSRDERELRVVSREPGPEGAERPVGIWEKGSKLIVAPAPGDKGGARQMSIEVPRNFAIGIDATDSDISISAAGGVIDLRGNNVRAFIDGNTGSRAAHLEGGSLELRGSNKATLRLRGTVSAIGGMSGDVTVRATGGTISLARIDGATDVECDDSTLLLDSLSGSTRAKARRGETTVTRNKGVSVFDLSGTPLHLSDGKGDITVTSDAPVDFAAMAAAIHLELDGGSVRGKGNQGMLEVRTRNTDVNVASIEQGLRLNGNGLNAHLKDVGGELSIDAVVSDVVVDGAAKVLLNVDRGNVTIRRATGSVQATVTGGDVQILDGTGPVTLDLEGGDAEVSWASLSGDKDSKLVNKSGDLTVRFPASGVCRVEAKSGSGRVDSDLPTVRVMEGLTEAQGPIHYGNRPIINVIANGNIHLRDASRVDDAN